MGNNHCEFISSEGKRCRAYKVTGSKYCFTHSDEPEIVAMREEALKKAAESHKLFLPISAESKEVVARLPRFVKLNSIKGIKKAYITIIKAALAGSIDERRLGALTYALNGYVNALEKLESLKKEEGGGISESPRILINITPERAEKIEEVCSILKGLNASIQAGLEQSGEVTDTNKA